MGKEYNHHFHQQNLHLQGSTFLPMLCSRPSIKDVALPKWEDRSASFSNDPLSPKIGCMGQVKRTNKIVGFPTSHKLAIGTKSNNNVKYFKLKKLFSGKNLSSSTTINNNTNNYNSINRGPCRRREVTMNGASRKAASCKAKFGEGKESTDDVRISVVDMDPPLPVIKRVAKPEDKGDENNLWKRRSGGVALKSLQLQHIQVPRHQQLEVTTT